MNQGSKTGLFLTVKCQEQVEYMFNMTFTTQNRRTVNNSTEILLSLLD